MPESQWRAIQAKEQAAKREREAAAAAERKRQWRDTINATPEPDPEKVKAIAEAISKLAGKVVARQIDPMAAERSAMTMIAEAFRAGAFAGVDHIAERASLAERPHIQNFVVWFAPDEQPANRNMIAECLKVAAQALGRANVGADTPADPDWITVKEAASLLADGDYIDGLTYEKARGRVNRNRGEGRAIRDRPTSPITVNRGDVLAYGKAEQEEQLDQYE